MTRITKESGILKELQTLQAIGSLFGIDRLKSKVVV